MKKNILEMLQDLEDTVSSMKPGAVDDCTLHGICSQIQSIQKTVLASGENSQISYARMTEIATLCKDGLIEDDELSALEYLHDTVELSPYECDFFGVDFSILDAEM